MNDQKGWESFLGEGERIVWQGRPDASVGRGKIPIVGMIIGVPACLIAVLWMLIAIGDGGWKWAFGLLFFDSGALFHRRIPAHQTVFAQSNMVRFDRQTRDDRE